MVADMYMCINQQDNLMQSINDLHVISLYPCNNIEYRSFLLGRK